MTVFLRVPELNPGERRSAERDLALVTQVGGARSNGEMIDESSGIVRGTMKPSCRRLSRFQKDV